MAKGITPQKNFLQLGREDMCRTMNANRVNVKTINKLIHKQFKDVSI